MQSNPKIVNLISLHISTEHSERILFVCMSKPEPKIPICSTFQFMLVVFAMLFFYAKSLFDKEKFIYVIFFFNFNTGFFVCANFLAIEV